MNEETNRRNDDMIVGRNAVQEALRSGRTIDALYIARGNRQGSIVAPVSYTHLNSYALRLKKCPGVMPGHLYFVLQRVTLLHSPSLLRLLSAQPGAAQLHIAQS